MFREDPAACALRLASAWKDAVATRASVVSEIAARVGEMRDAVRHCRDLKIDADDVIRGGVWKILEALQREHKEELARLCKAQRDATVMAMRGKIEESIAAVAKQNPVERL